MTPQTKQALMARYHHLKDHLQDLDNERDEVAKELQEVTRQLFEENSLKPV